MARAAYALATWINPNNHALDGGRASTAMEREAVAQIAAMFGWQEHLATSPAEAPWPTWRRCGWRASFIPARRWRLRRSRTTRTSASAVCCDCPSRNSHRLSRPHGPQRARGAAQGRRHRLCGGHARNHRDRLGGPSARNPGAAGAIRIPRPRRCGYGGYFTLADNLAPETRAAFDRIAEADSIVIDPHKHVCSLRMRLRVVPRSGVGHAIQHDSPATYFSSKEIHLGEISLECSRRGLRPWPCGLPCAPCRSTAEASSPRACRVPPAALELHKRLLQDSRSVSRLRRNSTS